MATSQLKALPAGRHDLDPQDALTTVAEIAIAIAGFSGVAAVLGRRSQGEWTPLDVLRLRMLLRISFSIVIFCFLPIVLLSASIAADSTWALSSAAWLAQFAVNAALFGREGRRIAKLAGESIERGRVVRLLLLGGGIAVLHVLNIVAVREAWPYLAALVASLTAPFAQFLRLMRSVLGSPGAA